MTLVGSGFIEANASSYQFGTSVVVDGSVSAGPDVLDYGYVPSYTPGVNGFVTLTVPLGAGSFGPISVTTAGGTSAVFSTSLSGLVATALSGTAANPALASANPGQSVTLTGSGLSTGAALLLTYTNSNGTPTTVLVSPSTAAADGSSATLILPGYVNGIATLSWLGSSTTQTLQIVPKLTAYDVSGSTLQLFGSGLVEGASTYTLPGTAVVDTAVSGGPDVLNNVSGSDNTYVNLTEPAHGQGVVTVTTAGGTSAGLSLNAFNPAVGAIGDVAAVTSSGLVWVSDTNNPGKLDLVDPTSGAVTRSITLTNAFGTPYLFNYAGLQVLGSAMTLNATTVPAGSLLVFNGYPNPDQVIAVNPTTGTVIATLVLANNYDLVAGTYDATSGHLFVIDRRANTTRVVEINPATAAEVSSFALPFNTSSNAGLVIDPATGTLWYGSDQSSDLVQLTRAGVELRRVSLTAQSESGSVSGLSLDGSGNLLVSTTQGQVYRINPGYDPAVTTPTPSLTAVTATAQGGTPANAAVASANAGQVISLTGTNFGAGTEVVFPTRDNTGTVSQQAVTPLAISADGKSLQVQVPTLATTGAIQVVNVGSQNLGYSSNNDAIYRAVTVQFTAGSAAAAVAFADGGLQGINDESWGIDNVVVSQGATPVFSDNFESGTANAAWSQTAVDSADLGVFSHFLGRFSGGGTTLNLSGLTAGQTYTVRFDLYVLDSWDGTNTSAGPDIFQVSVDGSTKLSVALTNFTTDVQTFNGSATIPLQIVPTLSAISGRPGTDTAFDLLGSGFQDGASAVTIGGVTLTGSYANQSSFGVTGTTNSDLHLTAPLTVEGPIRVTTAGGYAQISGPLFPAQPPVQFTGIATIAQGGTPADASKASANAGQTITLTGQGFTNATLVQFTAADDTGTAGTLTRTGTASADGTTLTLVVPELAKTGLLKVLGSTASYTLQIVPVLRSVGGTVASGNTIELDGTGLVGSELVIQIDGIGVGSFAVHSVLDANTNTVSNPVNGQQLLTLTVPAGIGAGVITVSTAGGGITLHAGVSIAATTLAPAADVGDTLATAQALSLAADGQVTVSASIGDGANGARDVDLYQITLGAGDQLSVGLNSTFYSELRIFDATGKQVATTQNNSYVSPNTTGVVEQFTAPAAGTYYVGISGYSNTTYDPKLAASGTVASYTGAYALQLQRIGAADSRLNGISTTAASGTPAHTGVASANIGQTITLTGAGLLATDQVMFTAIDISGDLYTDTVTPASVAADGKSLTVVVPADATTGVVKLTRDTAGVLLQVVPTLSHVDVAVNGAFNGGSMTLTGSGFAEGASTVHFGAQSLADTSRNDGLDVSYYGANGGAYSLNSYINLTTPNGVPTGPITVTTPGGSSTVYPLSVAGITATATTGKPADPTKASANAGQTISIQGTGLDTTTDVVFQTINSNGTPSQIIVHPTIAAQDGTSATVVVPTNAVTGYLRVVGDQNASQTMLQIVK